MLSQPAPLAARLAEAPDAPAYLFMHHPPFALGAALPVEGAMRHIVAGQGAPGTALDDGFTIACGEGAVQVTRAQRAGKGAQETETFLRGMAIPRGTVLGAVLGAD